MPDVPSEICPEIEEIRDEVMGKGFHRYAKEGVYRAVLKASFVRVYEYLEHLNLKVTEDKAEGFFACSPLRQCCEDLIALKYLAQLNRRDRDEVVDSLMVISTSQAIDKQKKFFERNHPFQPILTGNWPPHEVDKFKDKLTEVGSRTGLWNTTRKLPPIEQMAQKIGLSELYEFLYAATSEIVHFNVRIGLRSGWGNAPKPDFTFSAANFSRYYLLFGRIYSAYLFVRFSRVFRRMLSLSGPYMRSVDKIELWIETHRRWPEIVTFEEMNQRRQRNIIELAVLAALQEDRIEKLRVKHQRKLQSANARLALRK